MRDRFLAALAVTGGAHLNAFVNPGWVPPKDPNRHLSPRSTSSTSALRSHDELTLDVGGFMIPHPDKAYRGGEDAYFVLDNDVGVFDGVGGWAAMGHDPGVFTRGFAKAVKANIKAQRADEAARQAKDEDMNQPRLVAKGVDLKRALEYATLNAPGKGTCTACVVTFDPAFGLLTGANVGDSGALLIRRDARGTPFVALRSPTQRHKFNQPYQLGTRSRDNAEDAQTFLFYVREGDVAILATDGVLDNMYEADIVRCVAEASERDLASSSSASEPRVSAEDLAAALARRAYDLSLDKERLTPWEDEAVLAGVVPVRGAINGSSAGKARPDWGWNPAQLGLALERAVLSRIKNVQGDKQEGGRRSGDPEESDTSEDMSDFRGGKMDDITVVVATVRRAGIPTPAEGVSEDRNSGLAATDGGGGRAGADTHGR